MLVRYDKVGPVPAESQSPRSRSHCYEGTECSVGPVMIAVRITASAAGTTVALAEMETGNGFAANTGVGLGEGSNMNLWARGFPQPASLQAWTRTIRSPASSIVMVALDASTFTPSFRS